MKKLIILLVTGALISCAQTNAQQSSKEHISKEIALQSPAKQVTLAVYNMMGSIKVEGYSGNKVLVEIDKTTSAKQKDDMELGLKEFQLGIDEKSDSIIVYTKAPYNTRPNSKNDEKTNRKYSVKLDFVIKVPHDVNVTLSTINDGNLEVANVNGKLKVTNINGAIKVENAKGLADLHTINGNLDVTYASEPIDGSTYYTLNGTINATYPADLSADIKLKTMNGNFYTDFPDAEVVPKTVVKKSNTGNTYKLNNDTHLKIGSGENKVNFETLNGDIYIKKK